MAEEKDTTPKGVAKTQAITFAADDPLDAGLDLNKALPPAPWTVRSLGGELYRQLAVVGGYFDPQQDGNNYTPPLDPRSFAQGRFTRRVRQIGIPLPPSSEEELEALAMKLTPGEAQELNQAEKDGKVNEFWFSLLSPELQHAFNREVDQAAHLTKMINDLMPPIVGIGRDPNAQPLTPATLTGNLIPGTRQGNKRTF